MTTPRRALVLCDIVGRDGGTESYLSRVLPALPANGLDVHIAARRVVVPDAFGLPASELDWSSDDAPADHAAAQRVAELIERLKPAVIMTSNIHDAAVMAAARSAPRLVVRVHDHRLFCPQGDRQYPNFPAPCTKAMSATVCLSHAVTRGCVAGLNAKTFRLVRSRRALRNAALLADRFIVSSEYMAGMCALNGVAPEQLAVLPPPFAGEIARAARPAIDRVLFAGRLVRDKGLASLIRALALIPRERRPELAVAGSMTDEARSLPALAARLGVAMTMLGKLPTADLTAAIDASTLVAVPSLWPEPFGLMGIEAHARGRPVVAYDVGGIAAWMGAAGTLVPRGNERAFARAIVATLDARRWLVYSNAALAQSRRYLVDGHAAAVAGVLLG